MTERLTTPRIGDAVFWKRRSRSSWRGTCYVPCIVVKPGRYRSTVVFPRRHGDSWQIGARSVWNFTVKPRTKVHHWLDTVMLGSRLFGRRI